MRHIALPQLTDTPVPVIGVGAMPLAEPRADGELMPWDEAIGVLHHAFDLGMTLVDTADIYAPDAARVGYDERLVGEAVRTWPGGRDRLVVVTKIGIVREAGPSGEVFGRDGSRDYLLGAAERSVARLGFVPDAILLHRVNREQPFDQTVRAMLALREAGLTRAVGIGNVHLHECVTAWEVSEGTIAGVENERSPRYRGDADVVRWCVEHGVAYLAWSPLGGGREAARLGELYPEFAAVAAEVSASSGQPTTAHQVALAWISAQGPGVIPIPASTRPSTLESSAAAATLELTAEQLARLDASPAGRGSVFPD